jgi:hypothetical protein
MGARNAPTAPSLSGNLTCTQEYLPIILASEKMILGKFKIRRTLVDELLDLIGIIEIFLDVKAKQSPQGVSFFTGHAIVTWKKRSAHISISRA